MNTEVFFRVLAVDDDSAVIDTYKNLFFEEVPFDERFPGEQQATADVFRVSIQLAIADGGEGALHEVKKSLDSNTPFDVALLEHQISSGWDGHRTAVELRKIDPGLRIIFVSAHLDSSLDALRNSLGVTFSLVRKPFDSDELYQQTILLAQDRQRERMLEDSLKAQRETEKQLNEALKKAEQSSRLKEEFLASMSHELRTPLTSIIGNSQLIAEKSRQQDVKSLIHAVETAGRYQLALVNDILDMSKIESGKFTIENHPYSLSKLLHDVEKMLGVRAMDSGVKLLIQQKSEEPYLLLGDEQRIGQILINLIGNAVKFTESGGSVSLAVERDQEVLRFTVEDSGIGMSAEEVSRVFSRFEQASESTSRQFGGSGLGLYISNNLAQLMSGEIEVSSVQSVGSTFTLSLPYQCSEMREKRGKDRENDLVELNGALSGEVLVAEDTPMLQHLERAMLENLGLTVTIANNGQEAIELAALNPYDLILMDMQMPLIDGVEATRQIKASGNTTPIIALTANAMNRHKERFKAVGCDRFLSKPIDVDELKKLLYYYLKSSKRADKKEHIKRIEWSELYSVGDPRMDHQHQIIVGYINQLIECHSNSDPIEYRECALKILPDFNEYAKEHFKQEEALLESVGFGQLDQQRSSHTNYTDRIVQFYSEEMSQEVIYQLTSMLMEWWNNHILVDDMAYKGVLAARGAERESIESVAIKAKRTPAKECVFVDDELRQMFIETVVNDRNKLAEAQLSKEWGEIKEVAHRIKGYAHPFGYPQVTESAGMVCGAFDYDELMLMGELTANLIKKIDQVISGD